MALSDIVSHDATREIFRRSIISGKLSHSYIFCGIQGCGRRKLAVELVKTIFCASGGVESCEKCSSCRKINSGNHPDLHVLQPLPDKRDISIDQVREMQREMALRPYEADRKVCIIEPADRMNLSSGNSLLKTLEEPPGNAFFILITENSDQLLQTIRSRCQIIRFAPLSEERIAEILIKRGMDLEKAEILAATAEGSVAKALEQEDEDLSGLQAEIISVLTSLGSYTPSSFFTISEKLAGTRDETLRVVDMMISFLREIVSNSAGVVCSKNARFSGELQKLSAHIPLKMSITMLEQMLLTRVDIQRNANAKLSLDSLFLKLSEINQGY